MIANDTGFGVAHAHCFRIREAAAAPEQGASRATGCCGAPSSRAAWPADLRGAGSDVLAEVEAALADFDEVVDHQPGEHAGDSTGSRAPDG